MPTQSSKAVYQDMLWTVVMCNCKAGWSRFPKCCRLLVIKTNTLLRVIYCALFGLLAVIIVPLKLLNWAGLGDSKQGSRWHIGFVSKRWLCIVYTFQYDIIWESVYHLWHIPLTGLRNMTTSVSVVFGTDFGLALSRFRCTCLPQCTSRQVRQTQGLLLDLQTENNLTR